MFIMYICESIYFKGLYPMHYETCEQLCDELLDCTTFYKTGIHMMDKSVKEACFFKNGPELMYSKNNQKN